MSRILLKISKLKYAYSNELALSDIDFTLHEREILGIIGPNGAGKTTLIKLILGLMEPDSGGIELFGKSPHQTRHLVGYVPQHPNLDTNFPISAMELVEMGLLAKTKMFRSISKENRKSIEDALNKVGLWDIRHKHIAHLSGGEFQRILLARSLVSQAKLLILDEPFAGIDAPRGLEFYELLKQLSRDVAIILVSHDIGVIPNFVDKLCCLNKKLFHFETKEEALKNLHKVYGCPVDVIAHGIPHRHLGEHQ